jgi:Metallopeptidase family M24
MRHELEQLHLAGAIDSMSRSEWEGSPDRGRARGLFGLKEMIDLATRKVVEDAGYYDYYVHGCCHFVGLAVHDAGDYNAPLPVGAVITVEPGIYLPERGLGVRIEDEILITATGAEVLSKAIPKDPDQIERLMKVNHAAP